MREARTHEEVRAALRLRFRVFVEEQGVAVAADQDGLDADAMHVVAFEGGRLVGTCRVLVDEGEARLGRMAVEPDLRGRGAGAAILVEAERMARAAGAGIMRLHAQVAARSLYDRAGYQAAGKTFFEEGIAHVTMEKRFAS